MSESSRNLINLVNKARGSKSSAPSNLQESTTQTTPASLVQNKQSLVKELVQIYDDLENLKGRIKQVTEFIMKN